MFTHFFVYRLKTLLRDKELIFWTLAFPLILATLFHLTFGNLESGALFSSIPVSIVDNDDYQKADAFQNVLASMKEEDTPLFKVNLADEQTAEELLELGSVTAYIYSGRNMQIHVNNTGIQQSIIKVFLDQFSQINDAVNTILTEFAQDSDASQASVNSLIENTSKRTNFIQNVPAGRNQANQLYILYFGLIGMACFYGAYFGLVEVMDVQANLSDKAARLNLSPQHKLLSFLYNSSASFLVHFLGQLLLLFYLSYPLGISFAGQEAFLVLTAFVGSLAGFSMGAFIAAILKGNEDFKSSVISGITMVGAFLAGMMFPAIKFHISNHVPILSWLNPVNVLADAYYALYYFQDYSRYMQNLLTLLLFTFLFCSGTYFTIRRKKYANL